MRDLRESQIGKIQAGEQAENTKGKSASVSR
jgi:hypothetical protein